LEKAKNASMLRPGPDEKYRMSLKILQVPCGGGGRLMLCFGVESVLGADADRR